MQNKVRFYFALSSICTNFAVGKGNTMKLVILTKPTFFVEEDKILATLFDEGLDNLHLYKPNASPLYSERLLSLLPDDYYRKITVHNHYYLKEEYGLGGIHLDDANGDTPKGYKGRVSRTCRQIEELKEAKKRSDCVFLRNVFNSITEPDEHASFSREQLEEAANHGLIDRKVYAMGGMSADNIRQARELGFGGVVICGDLWSKFDIHHGLDYAELIAHFARLRKAIG